MKLMMKSAGGSDAGINHVWVFMKDLPISTRWWSAGSRIIPSSAIGQRGRRSRMISPEIPRFRCS